MKEITISISMQDVIDTAKRRTSYIGAKSQEEENFDRIAMVDEDDDELAEHWRSASASVAIAFSKWLISNTEKEGVLSYNIQVANATSENIKEDLEVLVKNFFVHSLLMEWATIISPDNIEFYQGRCLSDIQNIQSALLTRRRLKR